MSDHKWTPMDREYVLDLITPADTPERRRGLCDIAARELSKNRKSTGTSTLSSEAVWRQIWGITIRLVEFTPSGLHRPDKIGPLTDTERLIIKIASNSDTDEAKAAREKRGVPRADIEYISIILNREPSLVATLWEELRPLHERPGLLEMYHGDEITDSEV